MKTVVNQKFDIVYGGICDGSCEIDNCDCENTIAEAKNVTALDVLDTVASGEHYLDTVRDSDTGKLISPFRVFESVDEFLKRVYENNPNFRYWKKNKN